MTNSTPTPRRRAPNSYPAWRVAIVAASLAGCSPKKDNAQTAFDVPKNVTLTADQRQHVRLYTVSPSKFHKVIEATGAVDFDNDQATSVIAPISGPVSRLLVAPGDKVNKGAPLAMVDSPDFAAATSAYQQGRRHRPQCPPPCRHGQGSSRA